MAYTYTRTYTRPNLDVNFFKPEPAIPEYTRATFSSGVTPRLITQSLALSEDKYTLTRTMVFTDQAGFEAWEADPVIVANNQLLNAFNATNGIVDTIVTG